MDWRNRIGLYGSYFFGVAGIGFTLPFLPLYLGQEGLSDRAIGMVSTLAALAGLVQFPVGLWSDRLGTRKPFLIVSLLSSDAGDGPASRDASDFLAGLAGRSFRREWHLPRRGRKLERRRSILAVSPGRSRRGAWCPAVLEAGRRCCCGARG